MNVERTFFVKLSLDTMELGYIDDLALELHEVLASEGYSVIRVDLKDSEPTDSTSP